MEEDSDDLLHVDESGAARPSGHVAALRMQARAGSFHVLPSPADWLVLRRAGNEENAPRACLLSGEVRSGGALCDIASFVAQSGYKGELLVFDAAVRRSIFFDQGFVAGAESTASVDRLGEILLRYGILTKQQVDVCSEATATGLVRFGEAAVRSGFVTRETLFSLMSRQTEEIFYAVVMTGTGMFYFLESFDETALSSRQRLPVGALIREGVRRMHETHSFQARIPSKDHVPERVAAHVAPESDPLGVHAMIDGRRSVADLGPLLGQGEFEVSRALFQLIQSGHVRIKPPMLTPREMVAICNRAVALILRELDAIDEGDAVRTELAEFAVQRRVYPSLIAGAGPRDDGTFDEETVAKNVGKLGAASDETIAGWLHDYASYALFLARPHLRRAGTATAAAEGAAPARPRLSQRVAEILEPIAPVPAKPGSFPNRNKANS